MSPPAEKALAPAAVTITRVTAGSSAQASSCARKASTMPCVTALSACGRLSVTIPAAPRREKRMSFSLTRLSAPLPPRAFARGGEGSGVGGRSFLDVENEKRKEPPTPVRNRERLRTDPPRRFAEGGKRKARVS